MDRRRGGGVTKHGGGRPRRGRGGGRKRNERPAKSAADLDAEMEVGCLCLIPWNCCLISYTRITPPAQPRLLLPPLNDVSLLFVVIVLVAPLLASYSYAPPSRSDSYSRISLSCFEIHTLHSSLPRA